MKNKQIIIIVLLLMSMLGNIFALIKYNDLQESLNITEKSLKDNVSYANEIYQQDKLLIRCLKSLTMDEYGSAEDAIQCGRRLSEYEQHRGK